MEQTTHAPTTHNPLLPPRFIDQIAGLLSLMTVSTLSVFISWDLVAPAVDLSKLTEERLASILIIAVATASLAVYLLETALAAAGRAWWRRQDHDR